MNYQDLKSEIARTALKRKSDGFHIISPEGDVQDWIFDLRAAFMHPALLEDLARRFWEQYAGGAQFQIMALETASIPLLTAILLMAPESHRSINASFIRKSRKRYGLGLYIEGNPNRHPVILIDDVVNSGDSIAHAIEVLCDENIRLSDVFCVIDYQNPTSAALASANNVRIISVFVLKDFALAIEFTHTAPVREFQRRWVHLASEGNPFHVVPKSAPVVIGNRIYRGCDQGKMQAFDAATGEVVWEYRVSGTEAGKGIWSTPAISGAHLYFGAYNGTAYCLHAETGDEIWRVQCGDWIGASPLIVKQHNLVCFGIEYSRQWARGSIAALDMTTGALVWHHPVSRLQHGSPAYWQGGDLIVWGTADYEMLGIHASSGEVAWSFMTERSVKYAPCIDEARKIAAFASFDRKIYILDVSNGKLLGRWETDDICYTTPLIHGSRLYCGSGDGNLYVIDLDKMHLERIINVGSRVYSSPQLIDGRVIFGANCGRVFALDPQDLELRPVLMLPDAITNAVGASDDGQRIYISTNVNHLYSYARMLR